MSKENYYSRTEIINSIQEYYDGKKELRTLYRSPILSYGSKTTDTNEYVVDVVADLVYKNLEDDLLPNIDMLDITYCQYDRKVNNASKEEKFQRSFYEKNGDNYNKLYEELGDCIWFELQTVSKKSGKGVDLVYYNKSSKVINIVEVKYMNSRESLLRATMEIQTYFQRIKWDNAVKALQNKNLIPKEHELKDITINKYILVDTKCTKIIKEYQKVNSLSKDLVNKFKIGLIIYDENRNETVNNK